MSGYGGDDMGGREAVLCFGIYHDLGKRERVFDMKKIDKWGIMSLNLESFGY